MTDIRYLPSYIERRDDGEVFILANDGKYYLEKSLREFPEHLHQGYQPMRLVGDSFRESLLHWPTRTDWMGPRAFFTVRFLHTN